MEQLNYIDLRYRPTKKDLIAAFYITPNGITIEKAAENVAAESSIDTWTEIGTMNKEIATKLKPHVFSIDRQTNLVKIAYPEELFEPGNMPQILSSIAGNIFGMKIVSQLKLEDIIFTKSLIKSFRGPKFGIEGIRKLTGVRKRPLVGTIVKPKVGLSPKEHAQVAYNAWVGGCDVVKDDENLSSLSFNRFDDRIRETLALKEKAEKETGEVKIYMPNISAETFEMIRRANIIKQYHGTYMMIDILTVGWSGLQTMREIDTGLIIHAHRAGHAALTRTPMHGISMLTLAKIARLIGVDQLHIGTAVGKMEGSAAELREVEEEIDSKVHSHGKFLRQDWYDIKPVFPVSSGGLHPGHVSALMKIMGKDIVIQMGGGIHGHPQGTTAGAKAARQAIDATMKGIKLEKYALSHQELAEALRKWEVMK